jgi:hypothetical protein
MTGSANGDSDRPDSQRLPQFDGVVQPQGLTTYMYGTHVLTSASGETLYALSAQTPGLLEGLVGKHARLYGTLAPGYPVDDGPPLVNVQRAEELPNS